MRIALIRHATRMEGPGSDKALPLSDIGMAEAAACARMLVERDVRPAVCFTSWYLHARQTAEIVSAFTGGLPRDGSRLESAPAVVELCTLTPQFPGAAPWADVHKWAGITILEWLASEAAKTGYPLDPVRTAVFVMHEPRMRQLISIMTGGTVGPLALGYGEGVCLHANAFGRFLEGKGAQDGAPLLRGL